MPDEMVTTSVTGLEQTLATLATLDAQIPKIVGKANRAGAKVVLAAAAAAAPSRSGLLRENLRIRSSNKKAKGVYRAFVGVGAKDWTGPTFYGSFVLWGHRVGPRKLGGARREVPANDFLKRAGAQAGEAAANAVIDQIKAGVEAAAAAGGAA